MKILDKLDLTPPPRRPCCKLARVHGACTARTGLGNYIPQTDPHRKALQSNIGTRSFALLRL